MQIKSNGKQDKIEEHTSEGAAKSKKKKILIISGIVIVIMALLVLFLPAAGRVTPERAMRMRCNVLTNWHEHVRSYIGENNQKPLSLIEICQAAYRKGQRPFPQAGFLLNDRFPYKWRSDDDLVNDPNRFNKEVPYGLFQSSEGWLIRELKPGRVYKKMLMIDQDGRIYEISELPKEKYGHP